MPVEAGTSEFSYFGDGTIVDFQFPSRFLSADDLVVSIDNTEQPPGTYVVTGAGSANGGQVSFLTPPTNGSVVLLLRKPAPSQLVDFVNGQTVLEGTLDNALDRLAMVDQYALRTIARTVRLGDLDVTVDMTLPEKGFRSSRVFGFDINGAPEARDPYDMRSSRVTNVAAPTELTDAVRLQDLNTRAMVAGNVPPPVFSQIGFFLKATAINTFGWVAQTLGALAAKNTVAAADIDAGAVIESKIGTGAVTAGKIGTGAVTYDKIQSVSATSRVLGRTSAGAGVIEEIPVGTAANNLVRLDGSARLPAVDGSLLTKVTKLLASGTVSAQTQFDLVLSTYIAAGYTEFDLRISNLVAATNNTVLTLVVSTDGGATYQTSGYKGGGNTLASGSTASAAVGGSGQSLNRLSVFDVVGNATAKAATGVIRLFCKPQRFSLVTESGSENPTSSEFINTKLFGWGDQTNVNAIRLQFATGNITSLTYSLIGVA
jgi:hypothetical protein